MEWKQHGSKTRKQPEVGSVEEKDESAGAQAPSQSVQIQHYHLFLEDLTARGLISSGQMEELRKAGLRSAPAKDMPDKDDLTTLPPTQVVDDESRKKLQDVMGQKESLVPRLPISPTIEAVELLRKPQAKLQLAAQESSDFLAKAQIKSQETSKSKGFVTYGRRSLVPSPNDDLESQRAYNKQAEARKGELNQERILPDLAKQEALIKEQSRTIAEMHRPVLLKNVDTEYAQPIDTLSRLELHGGPQLSKVTPRNIANQPACFDGYRAFQSHQFQHVEVCSSKSELYRGFSGPTASGNTEIHRTREQNFSEIPPWHVGLTDIPAQARSHAVVDEVRAKEQERLQKAAPNLGGSNKQFPARMEKENALAIFTSTEVLKVEQRRRLEAPQQKFQWKDNKTAQSYGFTEPTDSALGPVKVVNKSQQPGKSCEQSQVDSSSNAQMELSVHQRLGHDRGALRNPGSTNLDFTFEARSEATENGEGTQRLTRDLRQQRGNDEERRKIEFAKDQERLRSLGLRGWEIAKYKEKKRQAKEIAKLELQTKKERDMVSSAIEAVIAESSNQIPSTSPGNPIPASQPPASGTSTPKANVFSMMMSAPGNLKKAARFNPPEDFTDYILNFKEALSAVDFHHVIERDWQKLVSKTIASCVARDILSRNHPYSHFQTRLNAMHALLEIATAVAYAPRSAVADAIRSSNTPGYLSVSIFFIAEKMSEAESKRVLQDDVFMETLMQLRRDPLLEWEGDTWGGLDEVLRALNYPGPVDFRRIYNKDVKEELEKGSKHSSSAVIKLIRRKIVDYVTHDTCFETKYNALNVLADIGVAFIERTFQYPWKETKLLIETLCGSLLKIGQTLKVLEVENIVEEFRMDENIPNAGFANIFDHLIIPGLFPPTGWTQERHNVSRAALAKIAFKTPDYCEHGLYSKLLHIRWKSLFLFEPWESSKSSLEELLSIFVDTFAPVGQGEYLDKLNQNFADELAFAETGILRISVDRSIDQITKRSSSKAPFDSRMNALKVLTKIGLQLVEFLDQRNPFWQTRIFKDQITEDNLTDAMRSICHSLLTQDRSKILADEELLRDLKVLDARRAEIPDAMLGMDVIMEMIEGTHGATKTLARKRMITDVIDLTEGVPAKRAASGAGTRSVLTIDLTDD